MKTALVLGGGGFIGGHLAKRLKEEGYWVRVVDIKQQPNKQFSIHKQLINCFFMHTKLNNSLIKLKVA